MNAAKRTIGWVLKCGDQYATGAYGWGLRRDAFVFIDGVGGLVPLTGREWARSHRACIPGIAGPVRIVRLVRKVAS